MLPGGFVRGQKRLLGEKRVVETSVQQVTIRDLYYYCYHDYTVLLLCVINTTSITITSITSVYHYYRQSGFWGGAGQLGAAQSDDAQPR